MSDQQIERFIRAITHNPEQRCAYAAGMSELQNPAAETPEYIASLQALPVGFYKFLAVVSRVEQFYCYEKRS
jgi:hypothetical protein